jgi:hypothetical protein
MSTTNPHGKSAIDPLPNADPKALNRHKQKTSKIKPPSARYKTAIYCMKLSSARAKGEIV